MLYSFSAGTCMYCILSMHCGELFPRYSLIQYYKRVSFLINFNDKIGIYLRWCCVVLYALLCYIRSCYNAHLCYHADSCQRQIILFQWAWRWQKYCETCLSYPPRKYNTCLIWVISSATQSSEIMSVSTPVQATEYMYKNLTCCP